VSVDWRNFVEVVEHLDLDLEFVSQAFVMLAGCNLLRQTSANKYDNNYRNGLSGLFISLYWLIGHCSVAVT
jgi:hypothetical protein